MYIIEGENLYLVESNIKTDMSGNALSALFHEVEVKDTSLLQLILLIEKNPILYEIYEQHSLNSFVERMLNSSKKSDMSFEKLELTPLVQFKPNSSTLDVFSRYDVSLKKKQDENDDQNYGVGFQDIACLGHCKIVINSKTTAFIDDFLSGDIPEGPIFNYKGITFGGLIHSLFYEFSFYGNPEQREGVEDLIADRIERFEQNVEVVERRKNLDSGLQVFLKEVEKIVNLDDDSDDENFESMSSADDSDSCLSFREEHNVCLKGVKINNEDLDKDELNNLLMYIPSNVDMVIALKELTNGCVELADDYIGLNAIEYRKKCYGYSEPEDIPTPEMKSIMKNNHALGYNPRNDYKMFRFFADRNDISSEKIEHFIQEFVEK